MLKVQELFKTTPWEEAIAKIEELQIKWHIETSPNFMTVQEYLVLDYSIFADTCNPLVKECRGIALYLDTFEIARLGFHRFLNYGQHGYDKFDPDKPIVYEEKADGSLIILRYIEGDGWVAGTRGVMFPKSPVQDSDITFESLFWRVFNTKNIDELDKNYEYIFEICSLLNRVVIAYETPQLVLLSARSIYHLESEVESEILDKLYQKIAQKNIRRVQTFEFNTIEEAVNFSLTMSSKQEGFVAKQWDEEFKGYKRVKIKGRAYIDLHHTVTCKSLPNLVRLVINGDRDYLNEFPEYLETHDKVEDELNRYIESCYEALATGMGASEGIKDEREKRKQFAINVPNEHKGVCFAIYDGKTNDIKKYIIDSLNENKSKIKRFIEITNIKSIVGADWSVSIDNIDADI